MKKSDNADKRRSGPICKNCLCVDCPATKKMQLQCKRSQKGKVNEK